MPSSSLRHLELEKLERGNIENARIAIEEGNVAVALASLQALNRTWAELVTFTIHPINRVASFNTDLATMFTERSLKRDVFITF